VQVVCDFFEGGVVSEQQSTKTTGSDEGDVTKLDTPLGGLAPARRVLLAHHSIEVAAAEVRFAGPSGVPSGALGIALRDAARLAGIPLDNVEPAQRQNVALTITPQSQSSTFNGEQGWSLTSADRHLSVTVMRDVLIVQNTRYTRYSDSVGSVLAVLLPAIAEALTPEVVQRIGLRYINRLTDPAAAAPGVWRGRITPEVLGVLDHPDFGGRVVNMQQQFELALEVSAGALVRHGFFRDPSSQGAYSYLLDIDVYDTNAVGFDPVAIGDRARTLNRTSLALFQQLVRPEHRETMGPYDPDEKKGPQA
jgi:uncharacterized protein (TIGR04255 family)